MCPQSPLQRDHKITRVQALLLSMRQQQSSRDPVCCFVAVHLLLLTFAPMPEHDMGPAACCSKGMLYHEDPCFSRGFAAAHPRNAGRTPTLRRPGPASHRCRLGGSPDPAPWSRRSAARPPKWAACTGFRRACTPEREADHCRMPTKLAHMPGKHGIVLSRIRRLRSERTRDMTLLCTSEAVSSTASRASVGRWRSASISQPSACRHSAPWCYGYKSQVRRLQSHLRSV